MPTKQNFSHLGDLAALSLAARSQVDVVQTVDRAAIDPEEMGGAVIMPRFSHDGFETPDMITDFGFSQQSSLRNCSWCANASRGCPR